MFKQYSNVLRQRFLCGNVHTPAYAHAITILISILIFVSKKQLIDV